MKPKDYLSNKKFCPMPWAGLMYNFDGSVKNCIRSHAPIGNIKDDSIQDILSGKMNTETQSNMLQGKPGRNCFPCYNLEKQDKTVKFDIISDRVFYLKELKGVSLETYDTVGNHDLHTIDVRWSNLCNFSCVYCSPTFSSKWASELGVKITGPSEKQTQDFKDYVFGNAKKLKHVYMAGGEPLLIKENLELLELLKRVNPDVNLRINTNLDKVGTAVFDRLCEFKNVHWTVSVETIEQEFEYIRYGGKWQDFLDNLVVIKQLEHKISFNMLHFLLNYNSIFGCIDYFKQLGFHNNSFIVGPILRPKYLNICNLPENMLQLVKLELKKRISECPGYLLEEGYKNMLQYLDTPFDKDLTNSFKKLKEMDQRRNVDSSKVFKDLYNLERYI